MNNVVTMKQEMHESTITHASVINVDGEVVTVQCEHGVVIARKAFSCFLEPEVEDVVLLDYSRTGSYILSILERETESPVRFEYPTGVNIHASAGDVGISSKQTITIASSQRTNVISEKTSFISTSIDVHADTIRSQSARIESHTKSLRLFADSIDTVAKQMKQCTTNLVRWVEGVETLNIGNLVRNIRHAETTHATQYVLTAKKDVRIDGERIHMG